MSVSPYCKFTATSVCILHFAAVASLHTLPEVSPSALVELVEKLKVSEGVMCWVAGLAVVPSSSCPHVVLHGYPLQTVCV